MIQVAQFLLSLSFLIILHELGHFIPARLFKTRVEKFYLFFNPWFSLVKKKIGGTIYGIGWLPLGGYVKIAGMIDESLDKEQMQQPAQPWEFRSKPAWQRLIIMIGGVTVNVILAIIIYSMVLLNWGDTYLPTANLTNGFEFSEMAEGVGFQDGDQIVALDGQEVDRASDILARLLIDKVETVRVLRDGQPTDVQIPGQFYADLLELNDKSEAPFKPRVEFVIDEFNDEEGEPSGAKVAGLQIGDRVISVDSTPTPYFSDALRILESRKSEVVHVGVERPGMATSMSFSVQLNDNGHLGVRPSPFGNLKLDTMRYNFFSAFPAGLRLAGDKLSDYVAQFALMFDKDVQGYKHVGGFITIGKIFSKTWDWKRFWEMTALLSIILAFMNLLPIPALDGGHVLFLLFEMVSGRKPGEKFLIYAQYVGLFLVLSLLVLANANDISKLKF